MVFTVSKKDLILFERLILEGDISLGSHAPLIRNILNDDKGAYSMVCIKPYLQIILGGVSRYWEYLQANKITIINSGELQVMYKEYEQLVSRGFSSGPGETDILLFSFQDNVTETLPRFHLCNTCLVPKFPGYGIYKELKSLGYRTSMIQFRDCVQLWYDDENISKHITS